MKGLQNSLILITVDCLRADHTGFLGYDKSTTPFLDSLANEPLTRVPHTAVFLVANPEGVPRALLHNLAHNNVLHERVVHGKGIGVVRGY